MSKLSRSAMLVASVLAACAFAMPAMASAAFWTGVIPSTHIFDTPNPAKRLSFSVPAQNVGWTCAQSQFHIDIRSATDATVTGARFLNCMGTGAVVNCTATPVGTRFPWRFTIPSTHDNEFHDFHLNLSFENTPGNPTACAIPGGFTVTGTLTDGTYTNIDHEIDFDFDDGLTWHPILGSSAVLVTGTLADTQRTTTMRD